MVASGGASHGISSSVSGSIHVHVNVVNSSLELNIPKSCKFTLNAGANEPIPIEAIPTNKRTNNKVFNLFYLP